MEREPDELQREQERPQGAVPSQRTARNLQTLQNVGARGVAAAARHEFGDAHGDATGESPARITPDRSPPEPPDRSPRAPHRSAVN